LTDEADNVAEDFTGIRIYDSVSESLSVRKNAVGERLGHDEIDRLVVARVQIGFYMVSPTDELDAECVEGTETDLE
jgi:hypothetical protein